MYVRAYLLVFFCSIVMLCQVVPLLFLFNQIRFLVKNYKFSFRLSKILHQNYLICSLIKALLRIFHRILYIFLELLNENCSNWHCRLQKLCLLSRIHESGHNVAVEIFRTLCVHKYLKMTRKRKFLQANSFP